MKKVLYSFFIICCFFCFSNTVAAASSCDKYQCITCKAQVMGENVAVTYDVVSDGNGGAKINFSGDNPGGIFTFNNHLESTNFISLEENSLVCPALYVKLASSSRLQTVDIYGKQNKGKSLIKKEMEKTKDNEKPFLEKKTENPNEDDEQKSDAKSCTYRTEGAKATVVVSDGKVDIQLTPATYKLGVTDLKPEHFMGECPTLQFACEASQKICSIFYESESGGHKSEGNNTENADDLKKYNDEIDRMPASSVDPSLEDALDRGCEIIQTGTATFAFLKKIINYVKIGTIFLVLVLGMVDLAGAVGSQEENAFKKAGTKFGKRLIAVALVFLVPAIVEILVSLVNDASCDGYDPYKNLKDLYD